LDLPQLAFQVFKHNQRVREPADESDFKNSFQTTKF